MSRADLGPSHFKKALRIPKIEIEDIAIPQFTKTHGRTDRTAKT